MALACIFHKLWQFVQNALQPQWLAAEVSARLAVKARHERRCRALLKANPEQETRKRLASKPAGRIFLKPARVYEICGLGEDLGDRIGLLVSISALTIGNRYKKQELNHG
jgi:hypothetical protein